MMPMAFDEKQAIKIDINPDIIPVLEHSTDIIKSQLVGAYFSVHVTY